jgi:tRNA-2-methylthio-N6-dimethylallyladenosine synthase
VGEVREAVSGIELGTDIIVGFPGENEEQFLNTVDLVKKVQFNVLFVAMYSPRPGTTSARLYKDDVSQSVKRRRHAYLTQAWKNSKKGPID